MLLMLVYDPGNAESVFARFTCYIKVSDNKSVLVAKVYLFEMPNRGLLV